MLFSLDAGLFERPRLGFEILVRPRALPFSALVGWIDLNSIAGAAFLGFSSESLCLCGGEFTVGL